MADAPTLEPHHAPARPGRQPLLTLNGIVSAHPEPPQLPVPADAASAPAAVSPPPTPPQQPVAGTAELGSDFPIGWMLDRTSWRFHQRWFAVLRRPMRYREYSQLLHQIRHGQAEHLGDDAWQVTIEDTRSPTLKVRASPWRLITILPRDWQPPSVTGQEQLSGAGADAQDA
jgi:hypothetical protein